VGVFTDVVLVLAAVPAVLILWNLFLYRRAPNVRRRGGELPEAARDGVSVVIPARNEQDSVRGAVEAALANRSVDLEVVVVDDASTDETAAIVRELARRDSRVRLESAPPLPTGWNGKQHACRHGAHVASHGLLVFVDADVRLSPEALVRIAAFVDRSGADLVSGVPRQWTGTFLERLLIPLIHFLLLGYLPMAGMRRSRHPGFAAGCGQLIAARRAAYEAIDGHGAVRGSRHDGITLPRAFRVAGHSTDLFDATDLAGCRMYRSAGDVWSGLAKNADEGMATPRSFLPWSVLLLGGHVLPPVLLVASWMSDAGPGVVGGLAIATLLGIASRLVLAGRFRQSVAGALLHPVGVAVLVTIQGYALTRSLSGRQIAWKGRTQT
jgi:hypothetical protein